MLRSALACLLALSACQTNPPPVVVCPTTPGDPVDFCTLDQAPMLVEATVAQWTTSGSRVLDLTGFHDTVFTPVALQILSSPRGSASGRLDVLMRGCIDQDGNTIDGPLQTAAGLSSGWFFIVGSDGYDVVAPQGFFRRDGTLLRNSGVDAQGINEADFQTQIVQTAAKPGCGPPDASFP